ncbi:ornithine cyclodeaminase family protein [Virgibacillus halodenitrificans]|nr:ornithine cyclodeaminase family protein [Virgibacillus halodenitrificans]
MLVLSEKDIQNNYFIEDAITDVRKGLISINKGLINSPHRTIIDISQHQASVLYMPSADLSQEIASMKVVSIFPENPKQGKPTTQGVLLLTDAKTGEHLCMMSASYLTRLRTGALSGIGTEKLARTNSNRLGIIGTGAMASEQVLGVLAVRKIESIQLFNRTTKNAEKFKERLVEYGVKQDITIVKNVDKLVQSVDILCCSTRSNNPVFNGELLKTGTHINGVGSYLPHMREVDLATIQRASKIVVDSLNGVKEEAGELIHANRESEWSFSDIYADLSELCDHSQLVREKDEEITFFKSVGAAYFDLAVAQGVYLKAKKLKFGSLAEI